MAKGDFRKVFGGSKSGYQKGIKDTLKVIGIIILLIFVVFIITKKK